MRKGLWRRSDLEIGLESRAYSLHMPILQKVSWQKLLSMTFLVGRRVTLGRAKDSFGLNCIGGVCPVFTFRLLCWHAPNRWVFLP